MALYHNSTRFAAIVTIQIVVAPDSKKTLKIGPPSAMNMLGFDVGVHDVLVGPGESIQLEQGVDAQFLSARGAL